MRERSKPRAAVLDFDGTLTDPWSSAAEFEAHFVAALAESVADPAGVSALWSAVVAEPDVVIDDVAVARASADPWLAATVRARTVLSQLGLSSAERERALTASFHRAYAEAPCAFRVGIPRFFEALVPAVRAVFIVSNSPPDRVRDRLRACGAQRALLERVTVLGGAQKFTVTGATASRASAWQARIGDSVVFEGASRPVALGRGRYLDALATVCAAAECEPFELAVCGDVFELDLAVPIALGARVCMVSHRGARSWERAAIEREGGVAFDDALPTVEALLSR